MVTHANHHPDQVVGVATRVETVARVIQTPLLISRVFQGHLAGTPWRLAHVQAHFKRILHAQVQEEGSPSPRPTHRHLP